MLRFAFAGYSIWLEPEPLGDDLDGVIETASAELGVYPIPAPHATVLYGVTHLPEDEVKKRFRDIVYDEIVAWPSLEPAGFITGFEIAGENGGSMVRRFF
jgi:hypothetical protein